MSGAEGACAEEEKLSPFECPRFSNEKVVRFDGTWSERRRGTSPGSAVGSKNAHQVTSDRNRKASMATC